MFFLLEEIVGTNTTKALLCSTKSSAVVNTVESAEKVKAAALPVPAQVKQLSFPFVPTILSWTKSSIKYSSLLPERLTLLVMSVLVEPSSV